MMPLAWVLVFCSAGQSITDCTPVLTAPTRAACRAARARINPRFHGRCIRMRVDAN